MPDVLHFDPERALDRMLKTFWRHGYKSTTTKKLAESAGLSESSLFNTFGSKREVFIASLERYEVVMENLRAMLDREDSALAGIREYWTFICRYAADKANARGCLITNASIEHADDPEISSLLKTIHRESVKGFRQALDCAITMGELREGTDTQALAEFLHHSTQGIRVLARLNPSKKQMEHICGLTMEVLSPYRTA